MPRITTKELKERSQEFLEEAGLAFDLMLGSDFLVMSLLASMPLVSGGLCHQRSLFSLRCTLA